MKNEMKEFLKKAINVTKEVDDVALVINVNCGASSEAPEVITYTMWVKTQNLGAVTAGGNTPGAAIDNWLITYRLKLADITRE